MSVNNHQDARCYALRRVNPFLGVLQCVELPDARASTTNGVVWHIELLSEKPSGWGSLGSGGDGKAWYLYGLWSEKEGLALASAAAQNKDRQSVKNSEDLVAVLRANQKRLPFALADRRELWLLDVDRQRPLALLCAIPPDANPPCAEPCSWSGCLGRQGVAGQRRFPEIDRLEIQVRKRAGFNLHRLWVTWDTQHANAMTDDGRQMCIDEFPLYGISEEWSDAAVQALVQRYIRWIAPSILTLPYLDDVSRARLESNLAEQAPSIEYHWRLYPRILDKNKILAARVKTKLLESGEAAQ